MRAIIFGLLALLMNPLHAGAEYLNIGEPANPPVGWVQFCTEHGAVCYPKPAEPRDIVYSERVMSDLQRVNDHVNNRVEALTDMVHWNVVEKWSYPDDGYGDCEDYVLLKQRILVAHGWPRSALLITVVRDEKDEGHAVLTVKTDRGEFVLDNQRDEILTWDQTGYKFIKRQSQDHPNKWVYLKEPPSSVATIPTQKVIRTIDIRLPRK